MVDIGYVSIKTMLARIRLNPYIRSEFNDRTAVQLIGQCLSLIHYKELLVNKAELITIEDYKGEYPVGLKRLYQVLYKEGNDCNYIIEDDCLCKLSDEEKEINTAICEKKKDCCDPLIIEKKFYNKQDLPQNVNAYNPVGALNQGFKPIYTSSTNFNLGIISKDLTIGSGNRFGNNMYSLSIDGFETTFRNGQLLIGYGSAPLDEDGVPMIPNDELIMELCESYYYYNTLKWLAYASISKDAATLFKDSEGRFLRLLGEVKSKVKMPSLESIQKAFKNTNKMVLSENTFNNYFGYY